MPIEGCPAVAAVVAVAVAVVAAAVVVVVGPRPKHWSRYRSGLCSLRCDWGVYAKRWSESPGPAQ